MGVCQSFHKGSGLCWICLDESQLDSSWIEHSCGCNLQIHKICYYRLLYDLNKTEIRDNYTELIDFEDIDDSLKRRICHVMDGHRDFHREVYPREVLGSAYLFGKSLTRALYLSPMSFFGSSYQSFCSSGRSPSYLLIEHATCPQCRKLIVPKDPFYTSRSRTLSICYGIRKLVRSITVVGLLGLSILNYEKWSFKLGLMQLRCIFPEKVLRKILDVSTTQCLDVYAETKNGRVSIPRMTHLLVLGFPLYIASLKDQTFSKGIFEFTYSMIICIRSINCEGGANGIASKTISLTNLFIIFYSSLVNPAISSIYEFMVKSLRPYFCLTSDKMDLFPIREYSDIIIRTEWYDVVFESVIWPFLGKKLGGFLYDQFLHTLSFLNLQYLTSGSPDEARMVFNIIGSGTIAISRQLFNLRLTYLRIQELKEIQSTVKDI